MSFVHCNVPWKFPANPSLGHWCGTTRYAYNKVQRGQTPRRDLTQDQIERLEKIGFKWTIQDNIGFEKRFCDLEAFKSEFGHCNVPYKYSTDPSLGNWCNTIRCSYKKIQQGQTPHISLTQDRIERMEEIGFKWNLKENVGFERYCHDLEAFKSEFGHCNVSRNYSANPSLGHWCTRIRNTYNQIQRGQIPRRILTQDQIARMEEIAFKWKLRETLEQRYRDLEAFKSEFGHCNVPTRYSVNPSLGHWCRAMRYSYNKMQQGQKPRSNLTQELIKRLEEIGFKWKVKKTIESEVGHCNVRRKNSADPLC